MSDYTATGAPIFGGPGASEEIRAEFLAVQTAVNSKSDKAGGTFTGGITATEITASVRVTTPELVLGATAVTATAAELNKLDGVTASTEELNYVDGVTGGIQGQIDAKVAKASSLNGFDSFITSANGQFQATSMETATENTAKVTAGGSIASLAFVTPEGVTSHVNSTDGQVEIVAASISLSGVMTLADTSGGRSVYITTANGGFQSTSMDTGTQDTAVLQVSQNGASMGYVVQEVTTSAVICTDGQVVIAGIPVYADNAAAVTGGLPAGAVYRTSTGTLMIRY